MAKSPVPSLDVRRLGGTCVTRVGVFLLERFQVSNSKCVTVGTFMGRTQRLRNDTVRRTMVVPLLSVIQQDPGPA
jgi:hypothetical protein